MKPFGSEVEREKEGRLGQCLHITSGWCHRFQKRTLKASYITAGAVLVIPTEKKAKNVTNECDRYKSGIFEMLFGFFLSLRKISFLNVIVIGQMVWHPDDADCDLFADCICIFYWICILRIEMPSNELGKWFCMNRNENRQIKRESVFVANLQKQDHQHQWVAAVAVASAVAAAPAKAWHNSTKNMCANSAGKLKVGCLATGNRSQCGLRICVKYWMRVCVCVWHDVLWFSSNLFVAD